MSKKTIIGMLLVLTVATTIAIISPASLAFAMEPSKLKIYAGPTSVPADNEIYECIFVQLQDSSSRSARATQDTVISLSSSLTSVGTVDPTITITTGNTYAVAKFDTTFTPGSTTIAATASGYGTVQTSLATVAPVPSKIALYGFPSILPSDSTPHDALVVQVQDSSGNPAKAPLEGIVVTLTSSNSTIVSVPASATIGGGQTYTLTSLTSTAIGSATITAQASGYTSIQTTINTRLPSDTQPKSLRIYVAPPKTFADNTARSQIIIQLFDVTGAITKQPATPIAIQLTSSSEDVGKIQSTIEVPVGQVYALATFSATYKAGTTTITAAATDLTADTEMVTTIGPIPSKLAVYCTPSVLPADNQGYTTVQVQLQDSNGKPALDPDGDVTVSLFSSEPAVGIVPTTLTIPYGKTYAVVTFTSTYISSTTSITAQASGYITGQAQMRTYLIDQSSLTVGVASDPTVVVSGKQANITAYVVDPGGNPISDATVKLNSSGGGTFATIKPLGNGYYTSMFTAPNLDAPTDITITATVSRIDYATSTATTQISVTPLIKYGTIQICLKDVDEQPIGNATVYSLSQPSATANLTGVTNSTGFVTFAKAAEGNYTFHVDKQGYVPINMTLNFKTTSSAKTLYLTKSADNQPADLTYVWLILIVVVSAILVVVVLKRPKHPQQHQEQ